MKNQVKENIDVKNLAQKNISLKENDNYNKYNAEILNYPDDFSEYEINFKIIVIGSKFVGKTCITNQATKHIFLDNAYEPTIGMEIYNLFVKIDNKIIKLQIWDTCGQEIYRSLISNYYRSSSLAIIVYSIDNKETFQDLDLWIKELKLNNSPDSKVVLVGNKLDLEENRQVSYEEGKKHAKDNGFIDFFETSAKTGENISKMFIKVSNILYEEHLRFKGIETDEQFKTFRENKPNIKLIRKKKKEKKDKIKCC